MKIKITKKQQEFIDCDANEVLYGGAAGGGKSWAQVIDAFLYALKYAKSRQLILRRTYPELEKSLIRVALGMYPQTVWKYNAAKHSGKFANGSVIDFGFCDNDADVYKYQSAEYDVIRFDELTHFTEWIYLYLLSRLRGANNFPKQIKSCTNPGGVGHSWVKERFIDVSEEKRHKVSRIYIPSKIRDNPFLMEKDPQYENRLKNLPQREQRALLHGDWDIFTGQFFGEFMREKHVVEPFVIPSHWRVYRALDYGLDMLCCLWIAVDEEGSAYVVREVYEKDLIVSEAAKQIMENTAENIAATLAPPDLWSRRQESGRSAADIFAENGVLLTKTSNDRVAGWLCVKEWLQVNTAKGKKTPKLVIFKNCTNLIRTLPALQHDEINPCDASRWPHEITHAPDALRAFCVWWTQKASALDAPVKKWSRDYYEDWLNASEEERRRYF